MKGGFTLTEAIQAICSPHVEDRTAFMDRMRASIRSTEDVVDLEAVRRGRALVELLILALEDAGRSR